MYSDTNYSNLYVIVVKILLQTNIHTALFTLDQRKKPHDQVSLIFSDAPQDKMDDMANGLSMSSDTIKFIEMTCFRDEITNSM